MKSKGTQKVKLTSYDELFGVGEPNADETIVKVPIKKLHSFKDHPFHVLDDEKMWETVESVKRYGVLMPGIVRPHPEDGYEVIAGHRRWRACELAGLEEMPVIIREVDDDTATVLMVDTNIQREDILPSEKAFAYKMKYDALRHQGSKGEKFTADLVGEAAGESGRTVQRYIRLTYLLPDLLDAVDSGKMTMIVGEKLSYLTNEQQEWVIQAILNCGVYPSKSHAEQMKALQEESRLTEWNILALLTKKESRVSSVTISGKKVRDYFPATYTKEQVENVIYMLLDRWRMEEDGVEEPGDGEDSV